MSLRAWLAKRAWGWLVSDVVGVEDRPGNVYVWVLDDDATREDREAFAATLHDRYVEAFGRPPRAVHIAVNEVEELKHLTRDEFMGRVQPFLEDA